MKDHFTDEIKKKFCTSLGLSEATFFMFQQENNFRFTIPVRSTAQIQRLKIIDFELTYLKAKSYRVVPFRGKTGKTITWLLDLISKHSAQ